MADGSHFVKISKKIKLRIHLKWTEMRSKVNFGHPKWPTAILSKKKKKNPYWSKMARNVIDGSHFVKNLKKIKVAYRSEMARNAFKSEFGISKMGAGGHFVKMFWKWPEMPSKVSFGHPKWAAGSHFVKKSQKYKLWYWSEMVRSDFWTSKMATGGHFKKKNIYKKVERVIWTMFKPTAGRIQLDINSPLVNINTDRYVGNEGIYTVFAL